MTILRNIVAATIILLVLISTPAVVEGTCKCKEVCPNFNKDQCWVAAKVCCTRKLIVLKNADPNITPQRRT